MLLSLLWQAAAKVLSSPFLALAQQKTIPADTSPVKGPVATITLFDPLKNTDFQTLLNDILQGLTLLAVPVATIMVMIGAYYLITSGGNAAKRTTGKNYILWAAIGFGVLLLASSVSAIVTDFIKR